MRKRQHAVNTRSPAGDAFSALVVQVLRLGGLLTAAGDALSKPAGQSSARWQVLAAADHAPMTVAQIARALGFARQSVQRVADLLEAEGLAEYRDNPEHLRAKLLHLTARGRAALAEIQQAQRGWANEVGAELGEADLKKASAILGRVLDAVTRRHPGP
ncbi:MAG TPA: MarR family transcriptional regulator [Myxococcales bacterium]|nr:MarR family transcriptional regulator [Myxococcales bacterium]